MTENRNFNDLYAFVQIVKWGNFSRAAQALNVQPSALSHRISELESRLNIKLLNRTTRSMSPTEAGQQLFDRIAPMFGSIQQEIRALNDFQQNVMGRLRINAAENPAYYLLYPKMQAFLHQFPQVNLEILINNSWIDIVAQGFDFGVRPLNDVAQDMVAVKISAERTMALLASPAYFERLGMPQKLQDIAQHRCIVPAFNEFNRLNEWEFMQNQQLIRISAPESLIFNSVSMVKMALLDRLGLSWLPKYAVEKELAAGLLQELFPELAITYPPMALYYPQNRHKTQAAQALID